MKDLTSLQLAVLNADVLRLNTCWEILLSDGQIIRVSNYDQPIKVMGKLFYPGGPNASSNKRDVSLQARTRDYNGVIDTDLITDDDLSRGKLRGAAVWEYLVNLDAESPEVFLANQYWVQSVNYNAESWTVTVGGITTWLDRSIGNLYTRTCRHRLGKGICGIGVNLTSITAEGVITAVTNPRSYFNTDLSTSSAEYYYSEGQLTWTSGLNNGISIQVRAYDRASGGIETWHQLPYDVQVGDTFIIYPGCNGSFSTCKTKFDNAINFGGFPQIPGTDKLYETPDATS